MSYLKILDMRYEMSDQGNFITYYGGYYGQLASTIPINQKMILISQRFMFEIAHYLIRKRTQPGVVIKAKRHNMLYNSWLYTWHDYRKIDS